MPSALEIKKIVRKDPVKDAVLMTLPHLVNAMFWFGKTGSGKTTGMLSVAQSYHDNPNRKYKIFDIWGSERNEQYYWTLPSRHANYWNFLKRRLSLDGTGDKQYRVELLFPLSKRLPSQLPFNPPHVYSRFFTIPFRSLVTEDFMFVKGSTTQTEEYLWRTILEKKTKKNDNAAILRNVSASTGFKSTISYLNVVDPLTDNQLLQSEECPHNLDIQKIMKDRETIHVLCLEFIDSDFHLFIVQYILRQIKTYLDSGKLLPRNIILMREVGEFFRLSDASVSQDRKKAFKDNLAGYIRMGRRGTHLFLDTQSPSETRGLVSGSEDFTMFGKIPPTARGDDQYVKDLVSAGFMTHKQKASLYDLEPGEMFVVQSGKNARKAYFLLPRTRYWEEPLDFMKQVWKKEVGRWQSHKEEVSKLRKEFSESQAIINEQKRLERARKLREKHEEEEKTIMAQEERFKRQREIRERLKSADEPKTKEEPVKKESTPQPETKPKPRSLF